MSIYRSIPEGAAQLKGFQQYGLSLFEGEVVAEAKADAHCTEARDRDLNVTEFLSETHDS